MYSTEKLLQMLSSRKASIRYDACEWLRVRQESSPEIVRALERAIYDEDKEVAERANYALRADVHHQMAIELGIVRPDDAVANRKILAPSLSTGETQVNPIVFCILGSILVIAGFVSIVNTLSYKWLRKNSESWPTTRGDVISTNIVSFNNEYGDVRYPVITYRYTVSGSNYSCDVSADESTKWDLYRKLQVGSPSIVYYDPERPDICVSEYDTVNSGILWIGLFFIALGSFFLWVFHKA